MVKEKRVSLHPNTFTQGGGLFSEGVVDYKEARFKMFDYRGKAGREGGNISAPSLAITMKVVEDTGGTDMEGREFEDFLSCGSRNDWMPSEDGKSIVPCGNREGLVETSNAAFYIKHLLDVGFPPEFLEEGDISCLDGARMKVSRMPGPSRDGLPKKSEDGREIDRRVLIVSEIVSLPGEAKTGKLALKKSGKKVVKEEKLDIEDVAVAAVLASLNDQEPDENGRKGIPKKDLPLSVMRYCRDVAGVTPNPVVQKTYDDDFLVGGPWTYENGVVYVT